MKLGDKYKLEDKIIPANKLSGDQNLANFINYARSNENRDFKYDFEIFNKDIYLSIKHNPKAIQYLFFVDLIEIRMEKTKIK